MKILFICLGNICRSPLAEGLFKHHVSNLGFENQYTIDSCGTGGWHAGELPDIRMRNTAASNGINLTHKARQLKHSDFDNFDFLLVMDHQNYEDVVSLRSDMAHKVHLVSAFNNEFKNQIVPDPYFGTQEGFDEVFDMLDKITYDLVHHFNSIKS